MTDGSFEQLSYHAARKIMEHRYKIIDDFYKAYAAYIMINEGEIHLDDICLVEQLHDPNTGTQKWWFEHKPKFTED